MTDYLKIIHKYYSPGSDLEHLLLIHSRCVGRKALECAGRSGIVVDADFVEAAAMLHDIGIVRCNAPGIFCYGELPYICHGTEGGKMLRQEGLEEFARVCERHTGSGLTGAEIAEAGLPLPHKDLLPETTEERLICYADKFFSKSRTPEQEIPLERVMKSMKRFGKAPFERFMQLHAEFGK